MHHQFRLPAAPYRYRMEGLLSHRLSFFIGTSERAPGTANAGEADPRHSIPLSPNSQKILMKDDLTQRRYVKNMTENEIAKIIVDAVIMSIRNWVQVF